MDRRNPLTSTIIERLVVSLFETGKSDLANKGRAVLGQMYLSTRDYDSAPLIVAVGNTFQDCSSSLKKIQG